MADNKMTHFELVKLVNDLEKKVASAEVSDATELKATLYPRCTICNALMTPRERKNLRYQIEVFFECEDHEQWQKLMLKTHIESGRHMTSRYFDQQFSESNQKKKEIEEREMISRELDKADMTPQEAIDV